MISCVVVSHEDETKRWTTKMNGVVVSALVVVCE